jgi:hypothetical protein
MYLTQFAFEEAKHTQVFRLWLDAGVVPREAGRDRGRVSATGSVRGNAANKRRRKFRERPIVKEQIKRDFSREVTAL